MNDTPKKNDGLEDITQRANRELNGVVHKSEMRGISAEELVKRATRARAQIARGELLNNAAEKRMGEQALSDVESTMNRVIDYWSSRNGNGNGTPER